MSRTREKILESVRKHLPPASPLPELDQQWVQYSSVRQQFEEMLTAVGGRLLTAGDAADAERQLQSLPAYAQATSICSAVPGVASRGCDLQQVTDPHQLAEVDFAVLPAHFGVAENGAVWVNDAQLAHRVLFCICQHLVLLMKADQILPHMHAAYERLLSCDNPEGASFRQGGYGLFISGPSKTADIEQSLVIGAHGARSLIVVLTEN